MTKGERRVVVAPAAQRQLRRLPPGDAARLRGPILALRGDPTPHGATKLADTDFWRLRVGELRVVFEGQRQLVSSPIGAAGIGPLLDRAGADPYSRAELQLRVEQVVAAHEVEDRRGPAQPSDDAPLWAFTTRRIRVQHTDALRGNADRREPVELGNDA